jgi:hypothetical protein
VTYPLVTNGSPLELNAAVKGTLRVGVLGADYRAVGAFAPADCEPVTGDSVRHIVSWRGGSSLEGLRNRVLRLRFELANARLFAFEVAR